MSFRACIARSRRSSWCSRGGTTGASSGCCSRRSWGCGSRPSICATTISSTSHAGLRSPLLPRAWRRVSRKTPTRGRAGSTLLDFNDKQALDAALSGGKGANLARLSQAGLAVPPGFVVTARAYLRFGAQARAVLARAAGFPFEDAARLETACKGLVRELDKLPVPDEVLRALRERLDCLPASTAFSVRSSATTEDLGGAAFAGQHDTYLNCKAFDDIASHLKFCGLSLWSARAVASQQSLRCLAISSKP